MVMHLHYPIKRYNHAADSTTKNMGARDHPRCARADRKQLRSTMTADGTRSDDEVAIIMGRARPTIRFHLQNASLKLGAVNRTQAVFRAAQLGFLTAPTGSQVGEWSAG